LVWYGLLINWQYQTNADNKLLHGSNLLGQSHKAVGLDCPQHCLQPHPRQYCTENAAKFHFVNFQAKFDTQVEQMINFHPSLGSGVYSLHWYSWIEAFHYVHQTLNFL
jgi:hypothetical protein